jgi:hypothetical protein
MLVLVAGAAVAPVAVLAQDETATSAPTATPTPTPRPPLEETPTTPTPTPTPGPNGSTGDTGSPPPGATTMADTVRINPVDLDANYADVTVVTADRQYNVTGSFAAFATTERLTAARVAQPKANARTMDGGHAFVVQFNDGAAPPNERSLYTVELFMADGSNKTVDLLVQKTDLVVVSSDLQAADDFLEEMKDDAEEHGYNATIAGITEYHQWEKRQADIFDNFLSPELKKAFAGLFAIVSSAILLLTIAVLLLLNWRRDRKKHANKSKSLMNGDNLTDRKRRELRLKYEEDSNAAAEHRLEDVDVIGGDHVYWGDLGVETVRQLAVLFAIGEPKVDAEGRIVRQSGDDAEYITDYQGNPVRDANGDRVPAPVMRHDGVRDLEQAISSGDRLRDTWLEPILRQDMLRSEQTVLAHARRALEMMTTRYGQPQYQEAHKRVSRLLDDLSEGKQPTYKDDSGSALPGFGSSQSGDGFGTGGSPAGGDD